METLSKVSVIESIVIFCMWDVMIGLNLKASAGNEKNMEVILLNCSYLKLNFTFFSQNCNS